MLVAIILRYTYNIITLNINFWVVYIEQTKLDSV